MKARRRLSSGDLLLLELVFAIVFFGMSARARKQTGDDKKDEQRPE